MIETTRKMAQALDGVSAIYGMGSYFLEQPFNDVDLVVIVSPTKRPLAALGSEIRTALAPLSQITGAPLDITIFTETEFFTRPLRDMHTLVPIYSASSQP
ncbi:hypothetical protein [Caulobacter rhizosphaerae]|jgi:hypothetical protein|uniref:hypothetical protein n=1 Tax=Caulobacter rhizosphaerae TaxID=2010972 RepID=UPI0013D6D7EC|nr:hypothetical protein [Caulobacter rhizosphaerae]